MPVFSACSTSILYIARNHSSARRRCSKFSKTGSARFSNNSRPSQLVSPNLSSSHHRQHMIFTMIQSARRLWQQHHSSTSSPAQMASLHPSPSTPPPPASPDLVNDLSSTEMAESELIPLPQSATLPAGMHYSSTSSPAQMASLPPSPSTPQPPASSTPLGDLSPDDLPSATLDLVSSNSPPQSATLLAGIMEAVSASPESSVPPPVGTAGSPAPLLPSPFPPSAGMAEAASTTALSDKDEGQETPGYQRGYTFRLAEDGSASDSSTGSSKRKLSESDVEDQADAEAEGDRDRRVHFAGPEGYLDLSSKDDYEKKMADLRAMIYFARRRLPRDPVDRLPQAGEDFPPNLDAAKRMLKAILVFLAVEVRILTTVSHENGNDLLAMTAEERADIWKTHFDDDPLGLARNMWMPVIHVVDFGAMFAPPPGANEHTLTVLGEWREYVYQCWVRNAEAAFVYWILRSEKMEVAADGVGEEEEDNPCERWVRMTEEGDVKVPDLVDLPVLVPDVSSSSKRRKTAVASGTELLPDVEGLDGGRVSLDDAEAESTTTD
ncbi:hypothetical protein IWZ00DRAFT_564552 [Phyllosticta capitalensis]